MTAIIKEEAYLQHFERLLKLLDSFQSAENASHVFQFLKETEGYDKGTREDILQLDYPRLSQFDLELKKLNSSLETKYYRVPANEARSIALSLIATLMRLRPSMDEEVLKKRLHNEFAEWTAHRSINYALDGKHPIQMQEAKPGAWPGFKVTMVDSGYLAEEYYEWVLSRFYMLNAVVEKFENGEYKKAERKKEVDKHTGLWRGIIFEEKRNEFIRLCDELCHRILFKNGEEEKYITYEAETDMYDWKGGIPALAQFIAMLEERKYFSFPKERGDRYTVCRSFLEFFKLSDAHVKYLSKEIKKRDSNYRDIFAPETWVRVGE